MTPKHTGSIQGRTNQERKLQKSSKSKIEKEWFLHTENQSSKVRKKRSLMSGIARSESSKHLLAWMLLGWRSIFHLNLVFLVDIRFIQIWKYFFLKNLKCSPFFLDALRYYLDTTWMLAYMPDLIDCCTFHVWFLCSCCTWVSLFSFNQWNFTYYYYYKNASILTVGGSQLDSLQPL